MTNSRMFVILSVQYLQLALSPRQSRQIPVPGIRGMLHLLVFDEIMSARLTEIWPTKGTFWLDINMSKLSNITKLRSKALHS